MRVRSPPEPLRVNVTRADPVHHLPNRHGSDGGEACSSITATDPPARTLFEDSAWHAYDLQPDARQRHPCRTSFDSFPGRHESDGGGGGNINSPPEMPPACMRRPASLQAILVRCGPLLIARAVVVRPSTMPVPRLRAGVRPGCDGGYRRCRAVGSAGRSSRRTNRSFRRSIGRTAFRRPRI